jgi:hypothetical protein
VRAAVLVIWCLTAIAGSYLLAVWLAHGGLRQQATRITVFPATLIFSHPLLGLAGLACWIGYLLSRRAALAWLAFACLCLTALLGFIMFTRWLAGRGGRHARGAEDSFPLAAVLLHGAAALGTFILVLIVAGRAGQG